MIDKPTFRGAMLHAGDDGYDGARRVFNAMIDRKPDRILQCADTADVAAGVRRARRDGLLLAVKSGGHSVAGTAVCDGGLVLDLSHLNKIVVNAERHTVTAQGGATLGQLDAATAAYGLATPTGVVSVTGLSGLALGGGLGWLNGAYGLTCDNLISADIVTAEGQPITASEHEHPDLFWAIRGGSGNFGVVTSFTLRLHPVGHVWSGGLHFTRRNAAAALRAYHELARTCPDNFTVNASVGKDSDDAVGVGVGYCHLGDPAMVDRLLRELRAVGPDSDTAERTAFVDVQRASDAGFPDGQRHYWKSGSLTDLADGAIAAMLDHVQRMPSNTSGVGLQQLHGAAASVAPTATAYPHRHRRYDFLILSQWSSVDADHTNIAWTNEFATAMAPFFDSAVYINNLGNEGDLRVRQAYGPNYERLVDTKTKYDPTNLFRHNHNVQPRHE